MRILAIWLIFLTLTSCATLINKSHTDVNLYCKQDGVKVFFSDTSDYAFAPVEIKVERSREPLLLTIEKDSIRKTIIVPSKLSLEYWLGNILGSYGLGLILDLTNDKRFKYPPNIYCDINAPYQIDYRFKPLKSPTNVLSNLSHSQIRKKYVGEKGTLNLKLSIPEGNSFIINKETHIGSSWGYLGITTGVDYYYRDKRYLGIGAGVLTDFIMPIPVPYDEGGEYEQSIGSYVDLIHGFDINRFSFNYGLSFSRYSYNKRITEELFPNYIDRLLYSKTENRIGLSLSSKFKVTEYFNVGIKYIPSLYTLSANEFRYGHFLFLDLAINFEIKSKSKKQK